MSSFEDRALEHIFGLCLQTSNEGSVCCVLPVAVGAYVRVGGVKSLAGITFLKDRRGFPSPLTGDICHMISPMVFQVSAVT